MGEKGFLRQSNILKKVKNFRLVLEQITKNIKLRLKHYLTNLGVRFTTFKLIEKKFFSLFSLQNDLSFTGWGVACISSFF